MKQLLIKLFDTTFWKFILVGIVNTFFGTAVMFICYNIFHLNYWISSAFNYVFGSILSYFLNKYFTFKNNDHSFKRILKFIFNISVCYLLAYGIANLLVMQILSKYSLTFQDNIAMLIGMCLFVVLNYIGQRFFVFRVKTDDNFNSII